MNKIVNSYIEKIIEVCNAVNDNEIIEIYDVLMKAVRKGGRIYICGNGGSASIASHFQTDLNNAFFYLWD